MKLWWFESTAFYLSGVAMGSALAFSIQGKLLCWAAGFAALGIAVTLRASRASNEHLAKEGS